MWLEQASVENLSPADVEMDSAVTFNGAIVRAGMSAGSHILPRAMGCARIFFMASAQEGMIAGTATFRQRAVATVAVAR